MTKIDQRAAAGRTGSPTTISGPADALRRLIGGYQATFLVQVAAELGLADLLADGPRRVEELAVATDGKPEALRRVLFALTQLGVLVRTADGRFDLTPLGACLCSDHPAGLNAFARYQGHAIIQQSWARLVHTVRTGETAFDAAFGAGLFEYLAEHPEAAALFAAGMAARTTQHAAAIVAGYDWNGFRTIVDIGGADGTLLTSILAASPNACGVIFDQPRMRAAAERRIAANRLQERCTFTGGDLTDGAASAIGRNYWLVKPCSQSGCA